MVNEKITTFITLEIERQMRIILFFIAAFAITSAYGQQPDKIGYADTDYIMSQMPELKALEDQLKATVDKLQNEFNVKQDLFQKAYAEYTAQVKTLADTARAAREQRLQQMSEELQTFQQDAARTLENTRKLHLAPVYLKVGNAIDLVAVEGGFSIILTKRMEGSNLLLYSEKTMDVSDLVLKKLGVTPTVKN